jgi:hypothetical protein
MKKNWRCVTPFFVLLSKHFENQGERKLLRKLLHKLGFLPEHETSFFTQLTYNFSHIFKIIFPQIHRVI